MTEGKRKVAYFYDAEIGNYHYGQGHPMKPHRVRMTHNLVVNYGLYREMEVFRPKPVSRDQMTRFHSDDYINFLRVINPDNMSEFLRHLQRCKCWYFSMPFNDCQPPPPFVCLSALLASPVYTVRKKSLLWCNIASNVNYFLWIYLYGNVTLYS